MDSTQLASSIVRVGVIGLGFAGETHLKAYQQLSLDACYASALQGREVLLAEDGTIAS